jgi:ABC-type lipoprotein export system ATPase subunit
MLVVKGLNKVYPLAVAALDGVNFSLEPHTFTAVLGPSGAGKTTLLRCVLRLVQPTGGSVCFDGHDLTNCPAGELRAARASVSLIGQQFHLVRRRTALANCLAGRLRELPLWRVALGLYPRPLLVEALAALERVRLLDQAFRRADRLSGGQQQRVAAARALTQRALPGAGDGSFWGTLLYFDGWNLNPDYGVAWENKWKVRDGFRIDQSAQFFFAEDGINGTVVGSQLESVPGAHMHSKAVLRLAPTWELADKSTFVLGLSGLTSEQEHVKADGRNNWVSAWAIDATYSRKRWQVFGEILQSYGVLNPMRYVSGGPSERVSDGVLGAQYIWGPVTFRATASVGFDEDPSGYQTLFVPGVTVAVTKNIDFYAEYVRWDVYQALGNKHTVYEDGIQLVINWRF